MQLSVDSSENEVVRITVSGQINQSQVSPFVEPLADLVGPDVYSKRVMLGLAEVELLDSSGVSWLLSCHRRFREAGGEIVLHSLSDIALNVIKVLRLQTVFKLAADEEQALRILNGEKA